ncbi:bifunctional hydroxymethylpyrimidine kinase/phosphomethylpyrimidine kinase [Verrucomicrobiaceae bacterium 5K15]|uniref:hydroxymethylpyrimidine kinase n=1 Tax=Oceaniferula flava TaxID=2800421 RepID=A0AAE2SA31_9BACT|nr:bifunctional hydroxymethylpyrimidine kinase/phosphomethylpyrimidine kinase [Oceaniferula flavus]MBK1854240.1 bifunctional hydroxymethylpyrimidine kinase/phosphomethylpyrimidine kinase [Oceaniferula flavus]MBM1135546.1 bifunctional hydroxymethylpyrimidine kinase/phosphomethylpyrimidine kinase [Oceaniferula flavus]
MNSSSSSNQHSAPPVALSIAGSDCSAGAGIQADLKTFQRLGVHGLSALTSVVSETPLEVREIEATALPLLQSQIQILLESYPVTAVKTGLLPSRACIVAVCEILKDLDIPIVVDPVMVASSGSALMQNDAAMAIADRLIPLTTLVTPNMPEASVLLDREIRSERDLEPAAKEIAEKFNTSCLVKGGHLPGTDDRLDVLWHDGAAYRFQHPDAHIGSGIHGTGCALSSAITAGIAHGQSVETAVENGIKTVQELITGSYQWTHNDRSVRCLGW